MSDDTTNPDEECKNFQAAYESGDWAALWGAIVFCAAHRIPNWEWLANEIVAVQRAAEIGQIKTWNDVFGQILSEGQCRGAQTRSRASEFFSHIWDARERVKEARDELAAAKKAVASAPKWGSEVADAALAKANAACRKAQDKLDAANKTKLEVWDEFGGGIARKTVERFYHPLQRAVKLLSKRPK